MNQPTGDSTQDAGRRYSVTLASWSEAGAAMGHVRRVVFIDEQQVPADMEWDGLDPECLHVLAVDGEGQPIGTGRLLPDGRIGRMAVLATWRGLGVGAALLQSLLAEALRRGDREIHLHAQISALGFYQRAGFVPRGEEFLDAGIRHLDMVYQPAPEAASSATTSTRQS